MKHAWFHRRKQKTSIIIWNPSFLKNKQLKRRSAEKHEHSKMGDFFPHRNNENEVPCPLLLLYYTITFLYLFMNSSR